MTHPVVAFTLILVYLISPVQGASIIVEKGNSTTLQCSLSLIERKVVWLLMGKKADLTLSSCSRQTSSCVDETGFPYRGSVSVSENSAVITSLVVVSARVNETKFLCVSADSHREICDFEIEVYAWPKNPKCVHNLTTSYLDLQCSTENVYPDLQAVVHRKMTELSDSDFNPDFTSHTRMANGIGSDGDYRAVQTWRIMIPMKTMFLINTIYVEMAPKVSNFSTINRSAVITGDFVIKEEIKVQIVRIMVEKGNTTTLQCSLPLTVTSITWQVVGENTTFNLSTCSKGVNMCVDGTATLYSGSISGSGSEAGTSRLIVKNVRMNETRFLCLSNDHQSTICEIEIEVYAWPKYPKCVHNLTTSYLDLQCSTENVYPDLHAVVHRKEVELSDSDFLQDFNKHTRMASGSGTEGDYHVQQTWRIVIPMKTMLAVNTIYVEMAPKVSNFSAINRKAVISDVVVIKEEIKVQTISMIVEKGNATTLQCSLPLSITSITWQVVADNTTLNLSTCSTENSTCADETAALYRGSISGSGSTAAATTRLVVLAVKMKETRFLCLSVAHQSTICEFELEVYAWPKNPKCVHNLTTSYLDLQCSTENVYPDLQAVVHRKEVELSGSDFDEDFNKHSRMALGSGTEGDYLAMQSWRIMIPMKKKLPINTIFVEMTPNISNFSMINRAPVISDDIVILVKEEIAVEDNSKIVEKANTTTLQCAFSKNVARITWQVVGENTTVQLSNCSTEDTTCVDEMATLYRGSISGSETDVLTTHLKVKSARVNETRFLCLSDEDHSTICELDIEVYAWPKNPKCVHNLTTSYLDLQCLTENVYPDLHAVVHRKEVELSDSDFDEDFSEHTLMALGSGTEGDYLALQTWRIMIPLKTMLPINTIYVEMAPKISNFSVINRKVFRSKDFIIKEESNIKGGPVIVEKGTTTTLQCSSSMNVTSITWQVVGQNATVNLSTCSTEKNTCVDEMGTLYAGSIDGSEREAVTTHLKVMSARVNETRFLCISDEDQSTICELELEVYAWPKNPECIYNLTSNYLDLQCSTENVYPDLDAVVHRREVELSDSDFNNNFTKHIRMAIGSGTEGDVRALQTWRIMIPMKKMLPINTIYVEMAPELSNFSLAERKAVISDIVIILEASRATRVFTQLYGFMFIAECLFIGTAWLFY